MATENDHIHSLINGLVNVLLDKGGYEEEKQAMKSIAKCNGYQTKLTDDIIETKRHTGKQNYRRERQK